MTLDKLNKKLKNKNERGQVLLLTMMLVATVLTVFLSMSFKSTTETQVTRLEEESQKALAAAEAGIEAALKSDTTVTIGEEGGALSSLSGYSGSALCSETYDKNYFVSPLVQKDEQYTFFLGDYPGFADSYDQGLTLYYGTENSCDEVSLELTIIYDADNKIKHYVSDSGNLFTSNVNEVFGSATGGTIENIKFNCNTTTFNLAGFPGAKLLVVRVFNNPTKLGFQGTVGSSFNPQGKICYSSATSSTVTKKVTLFQSYPQIPAEFFVTSF